MVRQAFYVDLKQQNQQVPHHSIIQLGPPYLQKLMFHQDTHQYGTKYLIFKTMHSVCVCVCVCVCMCVCVFMYWGRGEDSLDLSDQPIYEQHVRTYRFKHSVYL